MLICCATYISVNLGSLGTKHSLVGLTPTALMLPISCMKADLQQLSKSTICATGTCHLCVYKPGQFWSPHASLSRGVFSEELLTRDSLPSLLCHCRCLLWCPHQERQPSVSHTANVWKWEQGGEQLPDPTLYLLPRNQPVLPEPQCLRIKHPSIRVCL